MNATSERINSAEEGRAHPRPEQALPLYIREVIDRIEERSASLRSLVCRYREEITDDQRDWVAQVILRSIDDLKQTGEWFRRCQESWLIDRKEGEKLRSVTKKTELHAWPDGCAAQSAPPRLASPKDH